MFYLNFLLRLLFLPINLSSYLYCEDDLVALIWSSIMDRENDSTFSIFVIFAEFEK